MLDEIVDYVKFLRLQVKVWYQNFQFQFHNPYPADLFVVNINILVFVKSLEGFYSFLPPFYFILCLWIIDYLSQGSNDCRTN
jgi:hypothetical protein